MMAEQATGAGPATSDGRSQRGDRDGRGRRDDRGGRGGRDSGEKSNYLERVVAINRVSKVVKGGRRFSFTALVIVGDGKGMVGVGYGKAKEVPAAIAKGVEEARKNFFRVPLIGGTVTHPVQGEAAAGVVMLRPASPGTGVIAGGAARAILEEAGIHDVLCKSLGSANHINVARATIAGLRALKRPDEIARIRGLSPEEFVPKGLLDAYRETERGPHVPDEVA
jgi:small subunit ribosomal protein S5